VRLSQRLQGLLKELPMRFFFSRSRSVSIVDLLLFVLVLILVIHVKILLEQRIRILFGTCFSCLLIFGASLSFQALHTQDILEVP